MTSIELPWESEQVIESSKSEVVLSGTQSQSVITALISNLKNPTEFALVVVDDDESNNEAASNKPGFLGKLKSFANSATSQAVKMQRQVTAGCNKLASAYGVRLVLPLVKNVDFKISSGDLVCCWSEAGQSNVTFRLNNLSNKFLNIFTASREIAMSKPEFVQNGSSRAFAWLWKYQPSVPLPSGKALDHPIKKSSDDESRAKLLCLSWNVAGLPPPDDNADNVLASCFSKQKKQLVKFFTEKSKYDVVVIALQEASPLNAKTVLFKGSDTNYGEAWMEWLTDVLNTSSQDSGEWVKTTAIVQVGLGIALFVKNRFSDPDGLRVTAPMTSCVRTGTLGLTGNKGCVGVRCSLTVRKVEKLNLSVVNVHLASGEGKGDFRKNELSKVVNESSFADNKSLHFFDSDLAIVVGDLNSRIGDNDGLCISEEDELLVRMRDEGPGFPFHENPLEFPATYKLVPGEEGRLVFVSNRKPAWCDRVLFRSFELEESTKRFWCTEYSSLREVDLSDHTPIFATFELVGNSEVEAEGSVSTMPSRHVPPEVRFDIQESSSEENDSDLFDEN
jgi:hypothetical protein